jgi:hypothetical protein
MSYIIIACLTTLGLIYWFMKFFYPEVKRKGELFGKRFSEHKKTDVMFFSILVSMISILGGSIWIFTLPVAIIALGIYKSISPSSKK